MYVLNLFYWDGTIIMFMLSLQFRHTQKMLMNDVLAIDLIVIIIHLAGSDDANANAMQRISSY